jgi:hypothetical protein
LYEKQQIMNQAAGMMESVVVNILKAIAPINILVEKPFCCERRPEGGAEV